MDDDIFETLESLGEDFVSLDPEPTPEPEPAPAPEPEPAPAPSPEPEPEAPATPVEVITIEDLLDRITGEGQEETGDGEEEAPPQEGEETPLPGGDAQTVQGTLEGPIEIIGMEELLKRLETIQGVEDHPMMETPFEDYTVTEGLLLLIFVILLLDFFLNLLRRWF